MSVWKRIRSRTHIIALAAVDVVMPRIELALMDYG